MRAFVLASMTIVSLLSATADGERNSLAKTDSAVQTLGRYEHEVGHIIGTADAQAAPSEDFTATIGPFEHAAEWSIEQIFKQALFTEADVRKRIESNKILMEHLTIAQQQVIVAGTYMVYGIEEADSIATSDVAREPLALYREKKVISPQAFVSIAVAVAEITLRERMLDRNIPKDLFNGQCKDDGSDLRTEFDGLPMTDRAKFFSACNHTSNSALDGEMSVIYSSSNELEFPKASFAQEYIVYSLAQTGTIPQISEAVMACCEINSSLATLLILYNWWNFFENLTRTEPSRNFLRVKEYAFLSNKAYHEHYHAMFTADYANYLIKKYKEKNSPYPQFIVSTNAPSIVGAANAHAMIHYARAGDFETYITLLKDINEDVKIDSIVLKHPDLSVAILGYFDQAIHWYFETSEAFLPIHQQKTSELYNISTIATFEKVADFIKGKVHKLAYDRLATLVKRLRIVHEPFKSFMLVRELVEQGIDILELPIYLNCMPPSVILADYVIHNVIGTDDAIASYKNSPKRLPSNKEEMTVLLDYSPLRAIAFYTAMGGKKADRPSKWSLDWAAGEFKNLVARPVLHEAAATLIFKADKVTNLELNLRDPNMSDALRKACSAVATAARA